MLALGLQGGLVMLVDEATGEVKWEVQAGENAEDPRLCVAMAPGGRFVARVGLFARGRLRYIPNPSNPKPWGFGVWGLVARPSYVRGYPHGEIPIFVE